MDSANPQNRLALLSCIELAMMRSDNISCSLVVAKLNSLCDAGIGDLYPPDYLRIVMKEIYKTDYM